ncbi:MAG: DUF1643 domain-containing protein [Luteolibacter sp.]|nr:DUF1643 domain-containing protein [Luteolibacter sp.]
MKTGIELIAAERERQITEEGRTEQHDDCHKLGEMAGAAAVYALNACGFDQPEWLEAVRPLIKVKVRIWPWSTYWWKPSKDPVRDLSKAGALIAAEIDRLNRRGIPAMSATDELFTLDPAANGLGSPYCSAVLSSCGQYRYELWRRWAEGPHVLFIMLNPSTADATNDDATIRKCVAYARRFRACRGGRDADGPYRPRGERRLGHRTSRWLRTVARSRKGCWISGVT